MTDSYLLTKRCTTCQADLPTSAFHPHKKGKHGVDSKCKECKRAYDKARIATDGVRQRRTEYMRGYRKSEGGKAILKSLYTKHKAKRVAYAQKYNALHPERHKEHSKRTFAKNKAKYYERRKEQRREKPEYYRQLARIYRKANREAANEWNRAYYAAHPELYKIGNRRYKARKKGAKGSYTLAEWRLKYEYWGEACYLCRTPLTPKTAHIEHRIPISRGGTNWIANIAPACASCNLSKHDKTEQEFRASLAPLPLPAGLAT